MRGGIAFGFGFLQKARFPGGSKDAVLRYHFVSGLCIRGRHLPSEQYGIFVFL